MRGRSRGAELLQEATADLHRDAAGEAVQVAGRTIELWINGRKPGQRQRERLQEAFGIPATSWTEVAAGVPQPPPAYAAPATPAPEPEAGNMLDALAAQCSRFWQDVLLARNNPLGADLVQINKAEEAYAKALERHAKADGALKAVEEHRMTATLSFRKHVDKITKALDPYPEAMVAVAEALKQ